MGESKEAKALLKCYTQLIAVIQNNLNDVALHLRDEGIINKRAYDDITSIRSVFGSYDRAKMVWQELDNKIQEDKTILMKFLKYLSSEERYFKLKDSIITEYEKLGGQVDPAVLRQELVPTAGATKMKSQVKCHTVVRVCCFIAIAVVIAIILCTWTFTYTEMPEDDPQQKGQGGADKAGDGERDVFVEKEQQLFTNLQDIGDWDSLCTNLEVNKALMEDLRIDTQKPHLKKKECLTSYFESGRATWNKVVKVVAAYPFFKKALACKIATTYMGMDKNYCLDLFLAKIEL